MLLPSMNFDFDSIHCASGHLYLLNIFSVLILSFTLYLLNIFSLLILSITLYRDLTDVSHRHFTILKTHCSCLSAPQGSHTWLQQTT